MRLPISAVRVAVVSQPEPRALATAPTGGEVLDLAYGAGDVVAEFRRHVVLLIGLSQDMAVFGVS